MCIRVRSTNASAVRRVRVPLYAHTNTNSTYLATIYHHCEVSLAFCIACSQSCTTQCPNAARHEGTACMSAARHSTSLEWESEGVHGTELLCGTASRSSRIVMWTSSSRHVPSASAVRHYYSADCLARDLEVDIKQHMQLVEAIEQSLATLHTHVLNELPFVY